jgi:hypothetical protein
MRAILAGALILSFVPALSQFTPTNVDGTIITNDYGIHSNGAHQQTNGSAIWYMTWDANNLFLGITSTSTGDGAVIYFDVNPVAPINGGTNTDGAILGQTYDNTNFAALPFRADHVLYFKDGYREIRSAAAGGWPAVNASFRTYASASGVREICIPWSALGGRPVAFAWFGYVTTAGGNVYAEMPMENAEDTIGTSARYERYYIVSGTSDANINWPFSRNSFVFNRTSDWVDAGLINVYDFTMNAPGRTITRASNTATWIMSGNLNVAAGTVSFGSSYGSATVDCDVIIGENGALILSSQSGGDLTIKRHFVTSGTFTPNGRRVTFAGNREQTVSGGFAFDDLTISKSGGNVTFSQNTRVEGTLALTGGHIQLRDGTSLRIGANGNITGASAVSYIKTLGTGWLRRTSSGSGPLLFPIGTETSYNPVRISNAGTPDEFWVSVKAAFDNPLNDPRRALNRQWNIAEAVPGGSNATIALQWNAADQGELFNPASSVFILAHDGSRWLRNSASVTGSGPYVANAGGFTQLNKFTVANENATPVRENETAPVAFALQQNYPNPFNPSTEIRFSVEKTERATLDVFDMLGQHVATLFDGTAESGKLQVVRFDAAGLSSGTYFYRLASGNKTAMRKLVLMK